MKHPGILICEALPKQTITDIASALGYSRPHVSKVLHGHYRISPKFAISVEKIYGISAKVLVVQQALFDLKKENGNGN